MTVLKYWDVTTGAYQIAHVGPPGASGPQGNPGTSPIDSVQVVPGNSWIVGAPPGGTKLKMWCGSINATVGSGGLISIDITAAGFQYGYVAGAVCGDANAGTGGNNMGLSLNYNSTLTTLQLWTWYQNAWNTISPQRIEYTLIGA